jgi:hypothetical protein
MAQLNWLQVDTVVMVVAVPDLSAHGTHPVMEFAVRYVPRGQILQLLPSCELPNGLPQPAVHMQLSMLILPLRATVLVPTSLQVTAVMAPAGTYSAAAGIACVAHVFVDWVVVAVPDPAGHLVHQ